MNGDYVQAHVLFGTGQWLAVMASIKVSVKISKF